jgi:hypothetical protein
MARTKPRNSRTQAQYDRETKAERTRDTNARLAKALDFLAQSSKPNIAAAARRLSVPESTLRHRWRGESASREVTAEGLKLLSRAQERALVEECSRAIRMMLPMRPKHLQERAAVIYFESTGKHRDVR